MTEILSMLVQHHYAIMEGIYVLGVVWFLWTFRPDDSDAAREGFMHDLSYTVIFAFIWPVIVFIAVYDLIFFKNK